MVKRSAQFLAHSNSIALTERAIFSIYVVSVKIDRWHLSILGSAFIQQEG